VLGVLKFVILFVTKRKDPHSLCHIRGYEGNKNCSDQSTWKNRADLLYTELKEDKPII